MDKDFLKFMSFVAFMEAKKEAERDCSAEDTGWQDTIPTIRRKPDPATEALLLSRIRMPEKPVNKMGSGEKVFMGIGIIGLFDAAFGLFLMDAFYFLVGLVVGVSFIIMATSNAKKRYDEKLAETLIRLREEYDVPPEYVPLELTESAFLEDEAGMYRRMESLRERGFLVSMDDFGTGYSTMNMLKNQTLDEIKIDKEFIRDLEKDKSRIIIRNTIAMLQQLGVHIVIEGVETEEQKSFLLGCGCTDAQGFLFHRPMPVEAFDALLLQQECEYDRTK